MEASRGSRRARTAQRWRLRALRPTRHATPAISARYTAQLQQARDHRGHRVRRRRALFRRSPATGWRTASSSGSRTELRALSTSCWRTWRWRRAVLRIRSELAAAESLDATLSWNAALLVRLPFLALPRRGAARGTDALERWDPPAWPERVYISPIRDDLAAVRATCWACSSCAWAAWRRPSGAAGGAGRAGGQRPPGAELHGRAIPAPGARPSE